MGNLQRIYWFTLNDLLVRWTYWDIKFIYLLYFLTVTGNFTLIFFSRYCFTFYLQVPVSYTVFLPFSFSLINFRASFLIFYISFIPALSYGIAVCDIDLLGMTRNSIFQQFGSWVASFTGIAFQMKWNNVFFFRYDLMEGLPLRE